MGPFGNAVGQVTLKLPSFRSSSYIALFAFLISVVVRALSASDPCPEEACGFLLALSSLPVNAVAGPFSLQPPPAISRRIVPLLPRSLLSSPRLMGPRPPRPILHGTLPETWLVSVRVSDTRVHSHWHFVYREPCECGKYLKPPSFARQ